MKTTITLKDQATGKPLEQGYAVIIVKKGSTEQEGASFITDDNGLVTIDSPLLSDKAYEVLINVKGYAPVRTDRYGGTIELLPKKNMLTAAAGAGLKKMKEIPNWAWQAGGIVLAATALVVLISKKVK